MSGQTHKRSRSAPAVEPRDPHQPAASTPPVRQPPIFIKEASDQTDDGSGVPPGPRPVHNPGNEAEWAQMYRNKRMMWQHKNAVNWHEKWDDQEWKNGRVLIIEYCKPDESTAGKTRIFACEIADVHGLHKFFMARLKKKRPTLRVIHVQNARSWAAPYLLDKYNIYGPVDDGTEMTFDRWVKFKKPEWRAGKPLLKGRTWRTNLDPWRGVRTTAFGLDYLRALDVRVDDGDDGSANGGSHQANSIAARGSANRISDEYKMMEMNCYDDVDAVSYGWDVGVQRLSVYVQYEDPGGAAPLEDKNNPYNQFVKAQDHAEEKAQPNGRTADNPKKRPFKPLHMLDNGNTIIVFENSHSGSVNDTLISARKQIENRWRQLSFYLAPKDLQDESRLAVELMDLVLEDIFKALEVSWEHFLGIAETHVSILEDKIYDSPADESRAPELWYNSSAWLKVERLAFIHLECVRELITHLGDLPTPDGSAKPWLEGLVDQYEKLTTLVQEDLVKPTANLSDLMYKSVGIRDSRQSLGLSTSMWRLSWITFIFLPLTFIVGFFGMNVNIFADNPDIKWYFVAAVPLMVLVLILWYILKHALAARHQTPYQRGVYEHMFHDLAVAHPDLWSRSGPRHGVRPVGWYDALRWWLLRRWFDPRRTIAKPPADPDEDVGGSGLGAWARMKRTLARQWLGTLKATRRASISESEEAPLMDMSASSALVTMSTQVLASEGLPEARRLPQVTKQNLQRLSPAAPRGRSSSPRDPSMRPSSSGGSSGVMVDERDVDEGQLDADSRLLIENLRKSIDGGIYGRHAG